MTVQTLQKAYIPKVYVARFFQLVTLRQFAEAERVLERVKQKIRMNERNRGYFQALTGMLLVQKNNNDRYAFLITHSFHDEKEILSYRREFLRQSEFRLHADFDKGFFSAWADYMRILSKLELPPTPTPNDPQKEMKTDEPEVTKEAIAAEEQEETKLEEKSAEGTAIHEPRKSNLPYFSKLIIL